MSEEEAQRTSNKIMSAFEEQSEELEVLNSIYPTEITILSESPHKFEIVIVPNPGGEDNHVSVALVCEFPPDYPTTAPPVLSIRVIKGLSVDRGDELLLMAEKIASENIGLPSIFTIAEGVKEWLIDNNIPGQDGSMYSDMLRRQNQKEIETKKQTTKAAMRELADNEFKDLSIDPQELERIRKRQAGTQVTVETFMKWKVAFEAEMKRNADTLAAKTGVLTATAIAAAAALDDRPTGKQMFLQNKAKFDDDEVEALITAGESEDLSAVSNEKSTGEGEDDDDDDDDEDYEDDGEEDFEGDDDDDDEDA